MTDLRSDTEVSSENITAIHDLLAAVEEYQSSCNVDHSKPHAENEICVSDLAGMAAESVRPYMKIGNRFVIWVVCYKHFHPLMAHYPNGCLLITNFYRSTFDSENSSTMVSEDVSADQRLDVCRQSFVDFFNLSNKGHSQNPTDSTNDNNENDNAGKSRTFGIICGHMNKETKTLIGLPQEASSDYIQVQPQVWKSETMKGKGKEMLRMSPVALRMAYHPFQYYLLEDRLEPVEQEVAEAVLSLWKQRLMFGVIKPLKIPTVLYVKDDRIQRLHWDIKRLNDCGLLSNPDFHLMSYIGIASVPITPIKERQIEVKYGNKADSHRIEIMSIKCPLQLKCCDIDSIGEPSKSLAEGDCLLSINSDPSIQKVSAGDFMDLLIAPPPKLQDSPDIYRVVARYDKLWPSGTSDISVDSLANASSLGALGGPISSLIVSWKLTRNRGYFPTLDNSVKIVNPTAHSNVIKPHSTAPSDDSFSIFPCLNFRSQSNFLEASTVVLRPGNYDHCFPQLHRDCEMLQRLSSVIENTTHNKSDNCTIDANLERFKIHLPPHCGETSTLTSNPIQTTYVTCDDVNDFKMASDHLESPDEYEEVGRQAIMFLQSEGSVEAHMSQVMPPIKENSDGLSSSPYSLDVARETVDFVDRLWLFTRRTCKDLNSFGVILTKFFEALNPSWAAKQTNSSQTHFASLASGMHPISVIDRNSTPILPEISRYSGASFIAKSIKMATRIYELERYGSAAVHKELTDLSDEWNLWVEHCLSMKQKALIFIESAVESLASEMLYILRAADSSLCIAGVVGNSSDSELSWFVGRAGEAVLGPAERLRRMQSLIYVCEYVKLAGEATVPYESSRMLLRQALKYYKSNPLSPESPHFIIPLAGYSAKNCVAYWSETYAPSLFYILNTRSSKVEFRRIANRNEEEDLLLKIEKEADKENKNEDGVVDARKHHTLPSRSCNSKCVLKTLVCQKCVFSETNNQFAAPLGPQYNEAQHSHKMTTYSVSVVSRVTF